MCCRNVATPWETRGKKRRNPLGFNDSPRKKVLSLVLCVAVMLSVMVLGAGAAFSDQADIENTEAVDACSALNIIGGYEDGSFHPERNIKRSEITKMICVALNGGNEPNVSTNAVPTFSDVRGTSAEWAEGYIESCVAQGIVSGVGGGRFSPDGNVTGAQLAKMLLVALGYNAETENFTGNAWETNVNVRAAQKSLYDGLEDMDTSAAVTRDQAAQMVWNALQAYEVEYKTNLVTDANGNLSTQIVVQDKVVATTNDKISLLRDKYDALVSIGTLVGIDKTDLDINMSAADALASDDPDVQNFSKLSKDYSSLLGQKVTVIYTANKSDQVLGVFSTGDNTVYNVIANQTSEDDGKLSFGGNTYSVESAGLNTYVNGDNTGYTTLAELDSNTLNPNAYTIVDSDGNGRLDTLVVKTYDVAQVTYVASDKIIANAVTYKYADNDIADGIAKGDWVVITPNLYNDNLDIVKADVQTGTLDALRNNQTDNVYFDTPRGTVAATYNEYQIGDTWYSGGDQLQSTASENDLKTVKAGESVDYVAVNGIMFSIHKATGENLGRVANVALVLKKDDTGVADRVKLAFFDGTTKTVDVDDSNANTIKFDDGNMMADDPTKELVEGYVYEFSASGDTYRFYTLKRGVGTGFEQNEGYYGDLSYRGATVVSAADAADDLSIDDLQAGKFDGLTIDDNAQILLFDPAANDFVQITGKQFKSFNDLTNFDNNRGHGLVDDNTAAAYAFSGDMNGLDRIGALALEVDNGFDFDEIASTTWSHYGFIMTDAKWVVENKTMQYDVWTNNGLITVQEDHNTLRDRKARTAIGYDSLSELSSANVAASTSGTIYKIDGVDALVSGTNITFTAITDVSNNGNTVKFANNVELDVSGATILYVNSDGKVGIADGSIKTAIKDRADNYLANALYIDVGTDADLLIVDQLTYLKSDWHADARDGDNDLYDGVAGVGVIYGDNAITGNEKTAAIGTLPNDLKAGVETNKTITITTKNIANGTTVTAQLVDGNDAAVANGTLAVANGTVSGNSATIKLTGTPATAGNVYLKVSVDGVTKNSDAIAIADADKIVMEQIKEAIAAAFDDNADATGSKANPYALTAVLDQADQVGQQGSFEIALAKYFEGYTVAATATTDMNGLDQGYDMTKYTLTQDSAKITIADKAGNETFADGKQFGIELTITEDATGGTATKLYALVTLDATAAEAAAAQKAVDDTVDSIESALTTAGATGTGTAANPYVVALTGLSTNWSDADARDIDVLTSITAGSGVTVTAAKVVATDEGVTTSVTESAAIDSAKFDTNKISVHKTTTAGADGQGAVIEVTVDGASGTTSAMMYIVVTLSAA